MIQGADPKVSDSQSEQVERSACPTCGSCSGMFTANSMNCLTEALGLSQPGNGSMLATHADREQLFKLAGQRIVTLAKRWYEQDDASALPRNIATKAAFENAMALDIAIGGSTNTVLHLLAAAQEAGVDFTMADIDRMSRKVPQLCKVAPSTQKYHMEDVHRAGGVVAILGQLEKAGLVHGDTRTVLGCSLVEQLDEYDVSRQPSQEVVDFYRAGPAGIRTTKAFSQDCRWPELDLDRAEGCIRSLDNAYSQEGGLAVLSGNLAVNGAIVKTAGVDEENLTFRGPARVFESQESAVSGILDGTVKAGEVVVIRYEGPKGGPGMQEMLYPTTYLKSMGLGKACAPDHRWPFLRRYFGSLHWPRLAGGRFRRHHRSGGGWRYHQHQYPGPQHGAGGGRQRAGCPPRRRGSPWLEAARSSASGLLCPARLRHVRHQRR